MRSYDQPELYVADVGSKAAPRLLTGPYDVDVGGASVAISVRPAAACPSGPIWSRDGKSIFVASADQGAPTCTASTPPAERSKALTTGDQEIVAYDATPDGSRLALVVSTPTEIGDLFARTAAAAAPRRLTRVNEPLFSELKVGAPEEIWYHELRRQEASRPGSSSRRASTPARSYPLILNIHGGPHAAYGDTFDHEFQWMAAKGYVVLYPNPRGSTTYGQEFGNVIQYHYPGDDYKDLMAGVDELIRRGWVDPEAARRDRRQRRRRADELDIDADQPLQGRGLPALDRRLGGLLVHGGLLAVHADLVPGAPWEDPADFARALAHHVSSRTSRPR